MILNIHQNITINSLRIQSLTNASVLQIGSAGLVKSLSNQFNTAGSTSSSHPQPSDTPLVPLPAIP